MLIQKTLLQIEGVGRQLYPDLDLWETAQPLLRQWMRERYSIRGAIKEMRTQVPGSARTLASTAPACIQRHPTRRRWPLRVAGQRVGSRNATGGNAGEFSPPRPNAAGRRNGHCRRAVAGADERSGVAGVAQGIEFRRWLSRGK